MTAVIITGTPGTGKTSVSKILSEKLGFRLVHVNDLIDEKHLYSGHHPSKGYKIVDLDELSIEIEKLIKENEDMIVEGHLSHYFENQNIVDHVIVLRSRPDILKERLKTRNWTDSKVEENLEAEALDICTYEAVESYGEKVNEIDTTDSSIEDVAECIVEVVHGDKHFPPGNLNFMEYITH